MIVVTTQAREGIETDKLIVVVKHRPVTTHAREGIETLLKMKFVFYVIVTTQAREGIETVITNPLGSLQAT